MGGHDIALELRVLMSPITGKPYVWDWGYQTRKEVDLSTYTVPEHLLIHIEGRGGAYYIYRDLNGYIKENEIAADNFFANFPEWEEVAPKVVEGDYSWTEKDHTSFRQLAEWCSERPGFVWTWPY
jgi:hypothetical protein